jgi:uncharacterized protein
MNRLTISVVYAEPERQTVIALEVSEGTTVATAIALARLNEQHPGLPADLGVGIWGREVTPETVLAAGDRVELYRPLPQDPKETRRALARQGRTMGHGVGLGRAGRIQRKSRR